MHEHASMNRIFRLVWSVAQGCWVAVHERARGRGKAGRSGRRAGLRAVVTLLALGAGALGAQAQSAVAVSRPAPASDATPQGGQLVAGQASWQQRGANLVVNQSSARAAIDWRSFDIGSNASVVFRQPDASSVALNRVLGGAPSQIFGRLSANGQVFLTNASGIYFAPTAQVDVGALVATTHQLGLDDFMAGRLVFGRAGSTAGVDNEGQITAAPGGYVALLAPEVRNGGVVRAQAGTVALAAGEAIELQFDGGSLAKLRVTPADVATLIENRQAVLAPGGQILMSARAAQALQGSVIRNSGELSASSLVARGGRIVLEADHVDIAAGASITATGATGGGQINLGGSNQGQGELWNVSTTSVARGASIDASATRLGDGGTVVVWSNDHTSFDGSIAARGGLLGGSGGQVETSGKQVLTVRTGLVDVSARKGRGGTWLLDPNDLTIGAVTDTNVSGSFGTTDDDAFLSTTSLAAALTNGSNVVVQTNNAGTNLGHGDITVNGAITTSLAAAQTATLTLAAQGDINFATGGSVAAGGTDRTLHVNLYAGTLLGGASPGSSASQISMASGTSINTGLSGNLTAISKGDVTLANATVGGALNVTTNNGAFAQVTGSALTVTGASTVNAGSGEVAFNSAANQLGGAISSTGTGAVTIKNTGATNLGAIGSSSGSALSLDVTTSNAAVTQSGPAYVTGETTVRAGSGAVTLNQAGNQFTGAFNSTGTGAVTLANDIATTLGTLGTNGAAAASLSVTTSNDNVGQSGTAYVAGTTTLATGSGAVTLTNTGNQLAGAVSSSGTGAVTLRNAVDLVLGAVGTGGSPAASLSVRTASGGITQTGAALVGGTTLLRTDTGGAITVNDAGNQLVGTITTVGSGAVTLANSVATILGQIGSSGSRATSLSVTTTNDVVTQAGTAYVDGSTTVSAGTGAVTLDNANNKLTGAVSSTGSGAVTLVNAQALNLGPIGAAGGGNAAASLTATANGAVTQSGTAYVAGATTVNAGSAAVTLNDAGNQLAGAISAPGRGDVTVVNTVATVLGPIGATGLGAAASSLSVTTTNQDVTQTGAVIVGGATTLSTGAGNITLTNASNDFGGAVSATSSAYTSLKAANNLTVSVNGGTGVNAVAAGTLDATLNSVTGTLGTALTGDTVMVSGSDAGNMGIFSTTATVLGTTNVGLFLRLSSAGAVTQTGAITANELSLEGAGSYTLTNVGNAVNTIGAKTGAGAIAYVNAGALTVGNVNAGDTIGITRSGTVNLSTVSGDMTLGEAVSSTSTLSNAVVLNAGSAAAAGTGAGGNLMLTGSGTVSVGSGGRATLYSGTVAGSTGLTALVGSGSGRFRYDSDESTTNFSAALGAGVNAVYREQPTVAITADNLTRTYGTAVAATTSLTGVQNGDTAGQIFSTAPSVAVGGTLSTSGNPVVGAHSLTASGAVDALGYALSYTAPGTLTVNAATISAITGITAANKVYDTTTAATLSTASAGFTGMVSGDVLTAATSTGNFSDKNVANGKTVAITGLTLGGADAGNYTLASSTATTTANITPATISAITGITAADKVYDATTAATLSTGAAGFTGLLGGDVLNVAMSTGNFSDKNVANGKTVAITGLTLGGTDAGNYTLASTTASTTANITPATIAAITGITAANKVYDGAVAATLSTSAAGFTGMVSGDVLSVATGSGTFADKTVANGKTVSIVGLSLGGTDAGNYTLTSTTASTTANITPATISAITGITAANKVYDTTTAATLSTGAAGFTGMVTGDVLNVATSTGAFSDKNAATGKTVAITGLTLGGADAGNYTLASSTATTTADITQAPLAAITGITAANKVYDGSTTATLNTSAAGFTGLLAGDVVNVATATGNFSDKNVANGKAVSITGLTLGGTDAGNYNLLSTIASTTANITPATISAITGITAANKVYDTTTAATLSTASAGFTGMVSGDVLNVATSTGAFSDKNAATGKTVAVTGLTLGGTDAGNYTLASSTASTTANITPATISAITGITAANKVYDGSTTATLSTGAAGFTGLLGGDVLNVATSTGNFSDKNVANGKAVAVTGLTLGGTDAGNYTLTSTTASTTANITPATISAITGITAANKVYDTTTAATLSTTSAGFTGMVSGDVLNVATSTGAFSDKNAATGKTVNITGLTLGGTDAGNYTLASSTATTTADITQAPLAAITGITAANKVYDGNTSAVLTTTGAGFTGLLSGDVLNLAAATGNFSDKNVANGKTVTVSGMVLGGADAGNYALPTGAMTTTANITPATIAAITGITAANKVYDGATTATLNTGAAGFTGMVSGDVLNVATGSGTFADKNVANGKTVSIVGLSLGGTDAGNYTLTSTTASTTANITPATISAITGITAANKVYDTTTAATLSTASAGFTGMVTGDVLNVATATGAFSDKNAATGKTVNITGLALGGTDAGNYTLASSVATTTADITKAAMAAITGITAANKVYDGATTATLNTGSAGFTGLLAGDVVNVATATGNFSDKNVANGKTVSITGLTLGGTDAGNYNLLSTTASTTANITPATISAITGITAANKVYDTTAAATLSTSAAGFTGMVSGDVLNVATSTGAFSDKNAANGKTVAITGLTLGGTDAGNYTLASSTATTTANITQAPLSAVNGITAASKVYDATTTAAVDSTAAKLTGVLPGDVVSVAGATGTFANKNVGTGKVVTVAVTLGGADAGNYSLPVTTASADISRATLTQVTGIVALNKVEDGNAIATLATDGAVFNGKFSGDVLTVAQANGLFDNAHPGLNKPVAITGISLGGTDAGNYLLADTTATATASILARPPVLMTPFNLPLLPVAAGIVPPVLDFGNDVLVAGAPSLASPGSGPLASRDLDVRVLREPSALRGGDYQLYVPRELAGRNFAFTLPISLRGAIRAAAGTVRVQLADGRPMPDWLRYDAQAMRFTATAMPADGLPVLLYINLGNHQTAELSIELR
ncbi:YDG domain-containing protein [Roseateles sp. BYS78W]|uniref:YDG domain-containing protein n=1 Tax=Pelomonas candidula TaxID=3299025 RepID=A0ABW7H6T9_9BURK